MPDYFCTLVEAPMGGGKTNTVTGLIVDDLFAGITAIKAPDLVDDKGNILSTGQTFPCAPYTMNMDGMIVRLQCEDERLVAIPDDFSIVTPVKIFANYHLYGIPYVYASFKEVLSFINTDMMLNSKWVIDEGWLGAEARRGGSALSVLITEYAQLMRKLGVDLYWITQHARFLDWRIRYIAKRKILTKYDKNTFMTRLLIQDLTKGTEKVIHYYAPIYWRYYDTNEVPPMPQAMIQKAKVGA